MIELRFGKTKAEHKAFRCFIAILIFIFLSPAAFPASFNCTKAQSVTEKLICSDIGLSKLDEDLNASYKSAIEGSSDKSLVKQSQRDWLKSGEVTGCRNATCLTNAFNTRNELLKQIAPINSNTALWSGNYIRYLDGKEDTNYAQMLVIGLIDNRIYASGTAIFSNGNNGQINTGELDGVGKLFDNNVLFDLYGCKAKIFLKNNLLKIVNESGCGGLNVTFNGDYRKKCDSGQCSVSTFEQELNSQKPETTASPVDDSLSTIKASTGSETLSHQSTTAILESNSSSQTVVKQAPPIVAKVENKPSFWDVLLTAGLIAGSIAIVGKTIVTLKTRIKKKLLTKAYATNTSIGKFQSDGVYIKAHLTHTKRENKSNNTSVFKVFVPISKCETKIEKARWSAEVGTLDQSAYANAKNIYDIARNRYQNDKSQFEARESAKASNNSKYHKTYWNGTPPPSPSKANFVNYSFENGVVSVNVNHGWKIPSKPSHIINKNNQSCASPIDSKVEKLILNIYKNIIVENLKEDFDNTFDDYMLSIDNDYVFEQQKNEIFSEIEKKSNLGEYYKKFEANVLQYEVVISNKKYLPMVIVASTFDSNKSKITIHDSIVPDVII